MSEPEDKAFADVEFGEDLPAISPDISLENVTLFAKSAMMMAPRFINQDRKSVV